MALAGFVYVLALVCFRRRPARCSRAAGRARATARRCSGAAATCCSSSTRSCSSPTGAFSRTRGLGEKAVDDTRLSRRGLDRRAPRRSRADLLRRVRAVLRPAARGLPPAAVRPRAADAPVRDRARREGPARARGKAVAVAGPGRLRARRLARAVCARRGHGLPDFGLGHADARALPRGRHRGQRVERRHALTFGLDALGLAPVSARAIRWPIGLYAGGQFVASIGMFVAGGYGAARKTPTGAGRSIRWRRPAWRRTGSPRSSPSSAGRPSS